MTNCTDFDLFGPVSGNVNPDLLALLGLPSDFNPGSGKSFIPSIKMSDNGGWFIGSGNIAVAPVPEPGTLALFGTGLIALAGLVRRELAA